MKALRLWAAAALAGAIALAILLPRVDPSASLRMGMDREAAIDRARQLASRYGVGTAGWRAAVYDEVAGKHRAYLAAHPDDPVAKLFSPLKVTVVLSDPGGQRKVLAVLFPDGGPAEWRLVDTGGASASPPTGGVAIEDVLGDFLGANRPSFVRPATSGPEGSAHQAWEWRGRFPLVATIDVEQKNGAVLSVKLAAAYGSFDHEFAGSRANRPVRVALWVRTLAWIPALVVCFWAVVRGRFPYRIAVVLMTAQILWAAVSFWGSTYQQQLSQFWRLSGSNNVDLAPGVDRFGWSPWAGLAFFSLLVFAGAGWALRVAGNREKWLTLDLLTHGKIRNPTVAGSVARGLLAGIGLAAVPYVVGAISRAAVEYHSVDILVAPFPLAVAVRLSAAVLAVELFGFVFPLTGYLRKPWLRWAAFVLVGILLTAPVTPFATVGPSLVTGALLFGACTAIYLRADLLALMTALIGARAVLAPAVLLWQPAGSLRTSGLRLVAVGAAAIAASVHLAVRRRESEEYGRVPSSVPDALEGEGPTQGSRERLQAEFEVARKAQQDALPAAPPAIAGYSLSGSCAPAQQVGGDLYDFFSLPDGRLGITVADVSGKGVPAALYMMVTKGLLAAVTRDSHELAYILQQINLHLYRACRRRVFVTMAAVALDAPNRRLQYGRAGHNPMVWRRARRGETLLVKPLGLGLGMAPSEAFKRNLEVQELELEPDDAVVLYSDGITEAVNDAMDQFGEGRLMTSVESADGRTAGETQSAILRDLAAFMGATPARDDITLVVLRVAGEPA